MPIYELPFGSRFPAVPNSLPTPFGPPRTYVGPSTYGTAAAQLGAGPPTFGASPPGGFDFPMGRLALGPGPAPGPGFSAPNLNSQLDFLSGVPKSGNGFLTWVENTGKLGGFPTNPLTNTWQSMGSGGLMANTPGRLGGLVNRATSGATGTLMKGALRGLVAEGVARGIGAANQGLLGDTAADPTNWAQSAARGAQGGVRIGGPLGWVPGVVGTLGAAIGNPIGGALSNAIHDDGESGAHLGNVPVIGGMFGGGSAQVARDLESKYGTDLGQLTEGNIEKRLDTFGLTPEQRKAVTSSFNSEQASLRGQGMSNEEATAQMFQKYFTGTGPEGGLIKQFKEGKVNLGAGSDSAADVNNRALAYQALLEKLAPELMHPQAPDMSFVNELLGRSIGRLAESDPTMGAFAQQAQAAVNAQAINNFTQLQQTLAKLPQQYAAEDVAKAQAERDKLLYDVQVRQMAGGGGAGSNIEQP